MCGRFTLHSSPGDWSEIRIPWRGGGEAGDWQPRYNLAPSERALVVPNLPAPSIQAFRWGLLPAWAKDRSFGFKTINARAETLHERPSYRAAFRQRRCIVIADGFYEWKATSSGKVPFYFTLTGESAFAMAGLWEEWRAPEGPVERTFTIITTPPNALIAPLHDRMPAILPPESYGAWLAPEAREPSQLAGLLTPYPAEAMSVRPVSSLVNRAGNDSPACIEPRREPS